MADYNMSYSNIVNSLVVQFFLVACIVLFLMIGSQPRAALVPPALLGALQRSTASP
jgi:hypothetical protein